MQTIISLLNIGHALLDRNLHGLEFGVARLRLLLILEDDVTVFFVLLVNGELFEVLLRVLEQLLLQFSDLLF